jgi:hypothetical protein
MDSKKLAEIIATIQEFLENEVQEGISVVRYIDESMEGDGIKIDGNLLVQEIDGELMLERIIEIPATRFDPSDIIYEELCVVATIEEMLPEIKLAFEENQEEKEALSWMDYENDIETSEEEEDDDL